MANEIKLLNVKDVTGEPRQQLDDLVKSVNREIAALAAEIAALKAEPTMFAFGVGTTTGTGGVTPLTEYGGKLEIQGNNVALRFSDRRPDDGYVFGALSLENAERFPLGPTLASKTRDVCVIRMIANGGGTVNASAVAFSFLIWANGPRA